jgi:hypothetical protein
MEIQGNYCLKQQSTKPEPPVAIMLALATIVGTSRRQRRTIKRKTSFKTKKKL